MQGLIDIKEIQKAPLCWADKANELIKRANIPWEVKLPDDDAQWGVAQFTGGDNKIYLDLSTLSTVTFRGCDNDGNEFTFTCFGFKTAVE